ncbi:isopentenyl phosphate kinase [Cocos nucifera]|uniref:Isopentenyl phosphate kinase n=1 Tax=Cocos nucifera TaxID=13894 RepID=A0A8K0N3N8_COCNU|nr:isopentenyl phosphate kinase [Cocos nucifera]
MTPSKSPSPAKILGMDWSRRLGNPPVSTVDEFRNKQELDLDNNFIIVHGAGSFGHFQASRSGVHKGGLNWPLVKAGFVATRISGPTDRKASCPVEQAENFYSLAHTTCFCYPFPLFHTIKSPAFEDWSKGKASNLKVAHLNCSCIAKKNKVGTQIYDGKALDDVNNGNFLKETVSAESDRRRIELEWRRTRSSSVTCKIKFRPESVVVVLIASADASQIIKALEAGFVPCWCTNSEGKPWHNKVAEDGSWSIVKPKLPHAKKEVEITIAAHDTTGGMETKISEAAMIAKRGITVYITKAGTDHSLRALKGEIHSSPDDWLGTVIRSRLISSSK